LHFLSLPIFFRLDYFFIDIMFLQWQTAPSVWYKLLEGNRY
jgi:hypothetical protein